MSCQSCSGCFTSDSCSTKKSSSAVVQEKARFQDLLKAASVPTQEHNHLIPTVVLELSKNVYASHNVLIKAFDTLGLEGFLELADTMYRHRLRGESIAWADEYCQGDSQRLYTYLKNNPKELFAYCNDQAELHELFRSLPPHTIPRLSQQE
ncbi:hypothetical protein BY458DRAFT_514598 [Sporodiniella umbellata]|nr:hypothetical protein BY458DRAFT_514598 [Sporodiniella umbellata]